MKSERLAVCIFAMFMLLNVINTNDAAASEDVVKRQDESDNFSEQDSPTSIAEVVNGERESLSVPVISWRDLPFQTVKRQALDYSCGSAAVSTLLSYVYGLKTTEGKVFKSMFEAGNKVKIKREGFSLLDMRNYLNSRGFPSVGYKVKLDVMEKNKIPFIALINHDGYSHFVVVKSINGPVVLVGDPNKGNAIYTREEFEGIWSGVSLVVTNNAKKARQMFSDEKEWGYARPRALPELGEHAGIDSTALPFNNWQVAPARTDMLSGVNNALANIN